MPRLVLVRGARRRIEEALEEYKRLIYQYNSMLRGTGFYLKPVHIVTRETRLGKLRYIYIGRYWWRVSYAGRHGRTSRIRWVYAGREKPPELRGYPDPPRHPLAGLVYAVVNGEDVVVKEDVYEKYSWLFEGLEAVPLEHLGSDEPSPQPSAGGGEETRGGRR